MEAELKEKKKKKHDWDEQMRRKRRICILRLNKDWAGCGS